MKVKAESYIAGQIVKTEKVSHTVCYGPVS